MALPCVPRHRTAAVETTLSDIAGVAKACVSSLSKTSLPVKTVKIPALF
jgi:hypothetical protein